MCFKLRCRRCSGRRLARNGKQLCLGGFHFGVRCRCRCSSAKCLFTWWNNLLLSESRRVNKRSFSSLIASHRNKSNFPHWEYENPLFQMLKILAPLKKYLLRFLLIKPPRLLRVVFGEEISRFQRIRKFLFDIINWDLHIILDDIEYH